MCVSLGFACSTGGPVRLPGPCALLPVTCGVRRWAGPRDYCGAPQSGNHGSAETRGCVSRSRSASAGWRSGARQPCVVSHPGAGAAREVMVTCRCVQEPGGGWGESSSHTQLRLSGAVQLWKEQRGTGTVGGGYSPGQCSPSQVGTGKGWPWGRFPSGRFACAPAAGASLRACCAGPRGRSLRACCCFQQLTVGRPSVWSGRVSKK